MQITTIALALSLLAAPPLLAAQPPASAGGEKPTATKILVSFKLDPRLAGPTYGGERWVSPAVFTGAAAQGTVEMKARAVDARGAPTASSVTWVASDPEMVTVSALQDHATITVKRPGESSLVLKAGPASRTLTVKATQTQGAWQVYISQ